MIEMELLVEHHEVECIIGVWDHERITPQRVGLKLLLRFDGKPAASSDDLSDTINYAQLVQTADFILKTGKFQLLETAVTFLVHYFLQPVSKDGQSGGASFAEVKLTKYNALPGDTLASIRLSADRSEIDFEHETPEWGRVSVIRESKALGLYCLHIAPMMTLPLHHHAVMSESELILDEGLSLIELDTEPRPTHSGDVFNWAHHHVHGYQNTSNRWCRVLCIDSPPFIPEDEVLWKKE